LKHLVIGNSGFVGRHLESFLKKKYNKNNVFGFATNYLNLTKQKEYKKINKFIKKNTIIYFLAFNKVQKNATLNDYEINHKIITNFLNFIKNKNFKKFLFFSTQSIYGEDTDNKNINEKTIPDPTSYYGIAKYNSERLVRKIFTEVKIPFLIIRTPRIYGQGDSPLNYGPSMFADKFKKKKAIVLWGDGSEKRNYLFIDDVINIINLLILKNYNGDINICSNSNYSFKYLIQKLNFVTKNKIKIIIKKRSRKKVDQIMNNNFLKKIIGNYKFISINQGLKKILK
jgi:UDP-glucose 4-epimerase